MQVKKLISCLSTCVFPDKVCPPASPMFIRLWRLIRR